MLLGLVLFIACHSGGSIPPHETPTRTTTPPTNEPTGEDLSGRTDQVSTFLVAAEQGLLRVDERGNVIEVLSGRPALFARVMTPTDDVVFVSPSQSDVLELRLWDHRTGVDQRIAELPTAVQFCPGLVDVLRVQEYEDFAVDPAGDRVCMCLRNRNVNMLDLEAGLVVDLATRNVEARLTFVSQEVAGACPQTPMQDACIARDLCNVGDDVHTSTLPPGFSVREGLLRSPTGALVARFGHDDFLESTFSPDGRFSVVSGAVVGGDYIWRSLLLLDRQSGQLQPIRVGPWPEALSHSELGNRELLANDRLTYRAAGESLVQWLDPEHLVVDQLLVTVGEHIAELPGLVAQ